MTPEDGRLIWSIVLSTALPWIMIITTLIFFFKSYGGAPSDPRRIQVLVIGDIGRSPRMQYHALSLAKHGYHVQIIGYQESTLHPDIVASNGISVVPLHPSPRWLKTENKSLFLVSGPLKVLYQICTLFAVLTFQTDHSGWLLVQNPPAIPTLAVAQAVCLLRHTRLVIDWHNLGYSILALKLGPRHPFVRLSEIYESFCSRGAFAHICVTKAMANKLLHSYKLSAPVIALHDRPASIFKVLNRVQRSDFLDRLTSIAALSTDFLEAVKSGDIKLVVSSTSWTPDEDFSILLDALCKYSSSQGESSTKTRILVFVTGKGPLRSEFDTRVKQLEELGSLRLVKIQTLYFDDLSDYASLLGSADLGISLHTSSSGVDLPMKVVDMFGAGLPVIGFDDYEAWPELVTEGLTGLGFKDVQGLEHALSNLLCGDPSLLKKLRDGAIKEGERRWDDEWNASAKEIFV